MVNKKSFIYSFVFFFVISASASLVQANYVHPFGIFTSNGDYSNSPDLVMYVEITEVLDDRDGDVDFTFYNDSLIDSSIAGIYFDDGSFSLLGDLVDITNGPGTAFHQFANMGNLPGGNTLEPVFMVTEGLSFSSDPPPSKNGVNQTNDGEEDEWVRITFNLNDGGVFENVTNELDSGELRIGIHFIALPDGSSESAVTIPEPATVVMLGLGVLSLIKIHRRIA